MWKSSETGGAQVEQAIKQPLPPCQIKCPINEAIQRTNVLISLLPDTMEQAKDGIIQIGEYLYERNPFFNICGYICGACVYVCNYDSARLKLKDGKMISDTDMFRCKSCGMCVAACASKLVSATLTGK